MPPLRRTATMREAIRDALSFCCIHSSSQTLMCHALDLALSLHPSFLLMRAVARAGAFVPFAPLAHFAWQHDERRALQLCFPRLLPSRQQPVTASDSAPAFHALPAKMRLGARIQRHSLRSVVCTQRRNDRALLVVRTCTRSGSLLYCLFEVLTLVFFGNTSVELVCDFFFLLV